jgi:hypothetical protein
MPSSNMRGCQRSRLDHFKTHIVDDPADVSSIAAVDVALKIDGGW